MDYKVSYDKKEYNLNAVLSFDMLKEVLFKLLISQDKCEKEIEKIKNSNKKRDKDISKLEKLIKENGFDDDDLDDNFEFNPEQEKEEEENIENNESNENSPQKEGEEEEKTEKEIKDQSNINSETANEKDIINNENKQIIKKEKSQYDNDNKSISNKIDNSSKSVNIKEEKEIQNNEINDNDNDNKQNEVNNNEVDDNNNKQDEVNSDNEINNVNNENEIKNIEKKDKDKSKSEDVYKKEENKIEQVNINKNEIKSKQINENKEQQKEKKNKALGITRQSNNIQSTQTQIPPDLIRNMAKQIKDNKKRIIEIEKKLKTEIKKSTDLLKNDYQKMIKQHNLENKSEFQLIDSKFDEIFKMKEDLESKMEDCVSKCSTIDIYNMFKDNGDGTVDAAKVMVRALEERIFKKLEFIDTRYKKDALDNVKTKNNIDRIIPNIEKLNKEMENLNKNIEKNNDDMNDIKKDFDEQKDEIKFMNDDKTNIIKSIENLKNENEKLINDKIEELEKKIEEIKKKSSEGESELFKLGFGNKNIDEEAIQVLEKKINDLRKRTNDLENTFKLKNQDMEEIQNETKELKLILDKKITREDLKELYNMHLSDLDEINDLKDNASMTFDELRKTKSDITNILQKLDNINGNIVLLQNRRSSGVGTAIINFDKYIDQQKFNDTLKPILKEIDKICREIESFARNLSEFENNMKTFANIDRVNRLEDDIDTKVNDLKTSLNKKFVDKVEFSKNIKQIELEIKSLDLENKKSEGDSWIMAKKPVGCFNCASCEANIKNVTPSNEYLAWNKYPHQDKIYRMGQGFSHMLQMMTSEFVKSIGNAEKENFNDITSRSNNLAINPNLIIEGKDKSERKNSASVLKINNREQISEEILKKINNYNLYSSKGKGKVQLPRVLKFQKKLKLKDDGINNIPVSDDEFTGRNDSTEKEVFKENISPKILKIMKKKPFSKTEENLNFTQVNNTKS